MDAIQKGTFDFPEEVCTIDAQSRSRVLKDNDWRDVTRIFEMGELIRLCLLWFYVLVGMSFVCHLFLISTEMLRVLVVVVLCS